MKVMRVFYFFSQTLFFFFLISGNVSAQELDYSKSLDPDVTLKGVNFKTVIMSPPPAQGSTSIPREYKIVAKEVGVFIGAKPANFNGKILGIHPGFTTRLFEDVFTSDNYRQLYEKGYIVTYMSTSSQKGDFYNGAAVAKGIDVVLKHYGEKKMNLVGFSNGGVASEVAMYVYGRSKKIDKLYAIGTPFNGTNIADFGMAFPPVSKLLLTLKEVGGNLMHSDRIDASDLTSVNLSTTTYRGGVLRPFIDNHPDNRPKDVRMALSSSYLSLLDLVNPAKMVISMTMLVTGSVYAIMFGKPYNDGITEYIAGVRTGGILDQELKNMGTHHLDLSSIKSSETANRIDILVKNQVAEINHSAKANLTAMSKTTQTRNIEFKSTYQFPVNGSYLVDKNSTSDSLNFFTINQNASNQLELTKANSNKTINSTSSATEIKADDYYVRTYSIAKKNMTKKSSFAIKNASTNPNEMTALIQEDITATLGVDFSRTSNPLTNPNPVLTIKIVGDSIDLSKVKVEGKAIRKSDLFGQMSATPEVINLTFKHNKKTGLIEAETITQKDGIYSLEIRVGNEDFARNIVGGYTIGTLFTAISNLSKETEDPLVEHPTTPEEPTETENPTPIVEEPKVPVIEIPQIVVTEPNDGEPNKKNKVFVDYKKQELSFYPSTESIGKTAQYTLEIYDMSGKLIDKINLKNEDKESYQLNTSRFDASKIYLISINDGIKTESQLVVLSN